MTYKAIEMEIFIFAFKPHITCKWIFSKKIYTEREKPSLNCMKSLSGNTDHIINLKAKLTTTKKQTNKNCSGNFDKIKVCYAP